MKRLWAYTNNFVYILSYAMAGDEDEKEKDREQVRRYWNLINDESI